MVMSFAVTLACLRCGATLSFENERPEWKTYDYLVDEAEACAQSARFVTEFEGRLIDGGGPTISTDPVFMAWIDAGRPPYIYRPGRYPQIVEFCLPPSYRYLDCPVCDGQIKAP